MSNATLTESDVRQTAPVSPEPVGNPAAIGVPTFVVGSLALGLVLVGYVPATAAGASIPIIMTATGIGQVISAIWAARLAQNAVASVFGIFAGFWISYAALVLGLTHNWFGVVAADVIGVYLFADAMSAETGGKNLPLGTPVLH